MKRPPSKDESGVVAVVAAITALALIGVCAFAVDLGNAFSRKRDVQSQADFAALAGADQLGVGNTKVATDPAVIAVADYFSKNKPQDDHDGPTPDVTAAQLVDNDDQNGEVYFTGDRMRVVTPKALVDYGLAGVLGQTEVNVHAEASVKILSGGGVMPFFAVDGCDYGPQTISTPPPGPAPSLNLALPDNGNADVASVTPNEVAANLTPSPALTITGSAFTSGATASKVGFFLNDGTTVRQVPITPTDNNTINIPAGAITSYAPDVLTTEQVWYVRVFKGTSWSKIDNAKPLRVGSAVMECVGAVSNGNFGSLLLPRLDSNNSSSGGWLPINIAEGLQDPLTLKVHKTAAGPNWNCSDGVNGAVVSKTSPATLKPETNCLDTDTGLPDTSATAGFVTGGSNGAKTFQGRLAKDTTPGCGAQSSDRNARWGTGIDSTGPGPSIEYKVNDDLLTCFLKAGVTIGTISQDTYAGPAVLSEDIYRSPRFFLQPVLGRKPTCGGCEKYSIIDFRPAFLTDQPTSAVGGSMTMGSGTDHNGLSVSGGKVSKVKVVFFDYDALPPPPDDAPTSDYIGAGPKLIRLIN